MGGGVRVGEGNGMGEGDRVGGGKGEGDREGSSWALGWGLG